MTTKKTNAARLLDEGGIGYSLCSAPVDPDDLSAMALAASLGVDPAEMYKTLVLRGKGCHVGISTLTGVHPDAACRENIHITGPAHDGSLIFMACIPGPAELDLKKAARAAGCKSAAMVPLKEVMPLTGYVRGGCSPLAGKKAYPVFLDESAILHERIYVSAGQRGVQIFLTPDDLLRAACGQYADLCRE